MTNSHTPRPRTDPNLSPEANAMVRALSEAYAQIEPAQAADREDAQKRFEHELARLDQASKALPD